MTHDWGSGMTLCEWSDSTTEPGGFDARLCGLPLSVFKRDDGKWWCYIYFAGHLQVLAAENAHDAKMEGLDILAEWAVLLAGQIGELKVRTAMGDRETDGALQHEEVST